MTQNISVTNCAKLFMSYKDKINFGTKIHKYIESFFKTRINPIVETEDEKKIFLHFKEFLRDHPYYELVECEKDISYIYKNKKIVGKIDAVFRNVNSPKDIIIVDWKVKKDLDYSDNKSYEYILNLYAKMLKNEMPQNRIRMFLVLLHQHRASYVLVPVNNISQTLDKLLELSLGY
ncbi:hypothetical protein Yalta_104 [Yalta virus]|nr:hypothetical protein Yalta_104 [Yalta virus]